MVALSVAGITVKSISNFVQRSVWTVYRWLERNVTTGDLRNLPRTGRPALYSEETKLRFVAFYCQTQPLPDCGRWTLRWATRHLEAQPNTLGVSPSKSTLHRILQNHQLKPHRSQYFLHITDPDFFPKMEHLVNLYKNPPSRLFFFDECPGIQVLSRLTPDLRTDSMKQRLEEFEYIRNGTLDLFAFLDNADGKIVIECHADHKTKTFLEIFQRHVERFPDDESLHYVMDNLSSHRGFPFCRLVARLSGVQCPSKNELNSYEKRVDWLQKTNKRIVIHFTPFHGSWLNLVEIWFGIMGYKVLAESFRSPEKLRIALFAFADNWNLLWAHPFQWNYDGEGLQQKAIERFTEMLRNSASQINLRTLTKLLMLMTNLLEGCFLKIPKETWARLVDALSLQSDTITETIRNDPGPQRKEKAKRAIANLNAALQKHDFHVDLAA